MCVLCVVCVCVCARARTCVHACMRVCVCMRTCNQSCYLQVVATPYLHATLKPCIDMIFEEKKSCELDPSNVTSHQ